MTEAERSDSFFHKPVGPRAAIVAAGPIANFILAIVIFAGVFMFYGKQATTARVDTVQAGERRRGRRLQAGRSSCSRSTARTIESFTDMQRIVSVSAGETARRSWSIAAARSRRCKATPDAQRDQGQFRQRAPHRRARHQPLDGARRHQDRSRSIRSTAVGWAWRRPGS